MIRSLEDYALLAHPFEDTPKPGPFHLLIEQFVIRLAKQQVFRIKILKNVKQQSGMRLQMTHALSLAGKPLKRQPRYHRDVAETGVSPFQPN